MRRIRHCLIDRRGGRLGRNGRRSSGSECVSGRGIGNWVGIDANSASLSLPSLLVHRLGQKNKKSFCLKCLKNDVIITSGTLSSLQ
jgi:hypothetical protein